MNADDDWSKPPVNPLAGLSEKAAECDRLRLEVERLREELRKHKAGNGVLIPGPELAALRAENVSLREELVAARSDIDFAHIGFVSLLQGTQHTLQSGCMSEREQLKRFVGYLTEHCYKAFAARERIDRLLSSAGKNGG